MPKLMLSPDGHMRTSEQERQINLSIVACLETPAGREVIAYLRSITTNVASGPEISDRALMHLEGQRFLVGLLSQRINLGHKAKTEND